jgi:gamma-D-glutamyl-L-lysine dipeptidyl-peptidase
MNTIFPKFFTIFVLTISCVPGCGFYRNGWIYTKDGRGRIVRTAERYIGTPYRHGGTTPRGFDCSGYVMYVYRQNGILLPREVGGQYDAGKHIGINQVQPGDLVFFRTSRHRRLSHVGIYMGDNRFIHAPSSGKRVTYADMGKPYWKKRYRGAVTFIRNNKI